MIEQNFEIINKLGLHARAAAKFVALASGFSSQITVQRNDRRINGKSIMGLMMLAAAKGTSINVSVHGDDEKAAIRAIQQLISNRFDEAE